MNSTPILSIENLDFSYKKKQVLKNISFEIQPQEFIAIIGPNGCGKTTLVKTILKNELPNAGAIRLMGKHIKKLSHREQANHIAAVLQNIDPASMTVRDYVLLGRMPYFKRYQFFETREDQKIADKYMTLTGIDHLAESQVTQISGGERQLCAIARALTQEPDLLVLDEPTAHLDITHSKRILDLITVLKKELSLTILIVLHDLNLAAEFADRLILLSRKTLSIFSAGTPQTVLTERNIQTVYQTDVRVKPNPISGKPLIILTNSETPEINTPFQYPQDQNL